ncbi:MAG: hypothetical protein JXR89_02740 [Deltaproteobacteria bacterium]|nr:hypothetical protein [Deltaproteobacteria bacterium]
MKKFFTLVLLVALLAMSAPVFAGGGKVHSGKGAGSTHTSHNTTGTDDGAPGNVWW